MFNELRILYQAQVYPYGISGGYIRTFNIAGILMKRFKKLCVFSTDKNHSYIGNIGGVPVVQELHNAYFFDKINYCYSLLSKGHNLRAPNVAFTNMQASLFQIESPYYYDLLRRKGISKYILNEHNVNWELLNMPTSDMRMRFYNRLFFNRNMNMEIMAIQNALHVLVCSERDRQMILSKVPEADGLVTVIPNCIDIKQYINYKEFANERMNDKKFYILFVGLLSYFPNIDAVYSICNKIAPNFISDIEFIIIGRNPPSFKTPSNVKFLGYVDDIKKYIYESTICIAPLRYGSGTRLKILEYMAMGKPVIATSKGAEGIDYTNDENIIIEDNIDMFSERIRELIEKKSKRDDLGKKAELLIKEKYDWGIYQEKLMHIYEHIG